MPFDYRVVDGVIFADFTGRLVSQDLRIAAKEVAVLEEELAISPNRLTDISLVEGIDLNFQEMEAFADIRRRVALKNDIRSAIVVADSLQVGFARMFQTLNDHPKITIRIFNNREEAIAWVSSPTSEDAVAPSVVFAMVEAE
jgi:hypothetical protein